MVPNPTWQMSLEEGENADSGEAPRENATWQQRQRSEQRRCTPGNGCKDCRPPPGARERQEGFHPEPLVVGERRAARLTPGFCTSSLQNRERINFCHLSHSVCYSHPRKLIQKLGSISTEADRVPAFQCESKGREMLISQLKGRQAGGILLYIDKSSLWF